MQSESVFKEVYRGNEQQTELADLKPCSEFKLRCACPFIVLASFFAERILSNPISVHRVLSANALGESEWSEVLVVTTDKSKTQKISCITHR